MILNGLEHNVEMGLMNHTDQNQRLGRHCFCIGHLRAEAENCSDGSSQMERKRDGKIDSDMMFGEEGGLEMKFEKFGSLMACFCAEELKWGNAFFLRRVNKRVV